MLFNVRYIFYRIILIFILSININYAHGQSFQNDSTISSPNVILIMTDDQGYGDFGFKGNNVIKTPHLDLLAENSASLSDFYVHPVCSPTRASLMTGRHNYRTRVIDTWHGRSMMDPDEVTIADVLQNAGYRTGIFGKWHLGDNYPMRAIDQGFDEALVHLGGGIGQPSEPIGNDRRYTDPLLYHNGRLVHTHGYVTDVIGDYTNRFIRQAHANNEPFFVYLAPNAPHSPYHDVPQDWYEYYLEHADELAKLILSDFDEDELNNQVDTVARIFAMISNIDDNVGRVMKQLQDLDIVNETLVIYLNDNGPNTRRYVGPFRGMKTEVYEGGIRSPLWLHWPSRLSAGVHSNRPTAHIDLMPTILEACGIEIPEDLELDGRSLLPLLTNDNSEDWPERTITIQTHRGDKPQRYHHFMIRDDIWKLVNNSGFQFEELPGEPHFSLYNLHLDPGETNDLSDEYPEIVERLKNAYDEWFDDVSSTRPDNFVAPRIIVGASENPTKLTRQDLQQGVWRGDGPPGFWKLQVSESGLYDVMLLIQPAKDVAEIASISFGNQKLTRKISPRADVSLMRNVYLESGELDLSVELSTNGEQRPPYQVIITRRY